MTGPNQLWQFDIKYGHMYKSQFFYLCAFIDVFMKDIMGYHIGLRCRGEDILNTLKIALKECKIEKDLVIRSDKGPHDDL